MKLYALSLINGIVLIILGIWSHLWPDSPSPTALIPVVFGVAILLLNKGVRNYRKGISNAVMVITFMILLGLIFPLKGSIERGDTPALLRVLTMMVVSLISFIFFLKRFINDRIKNKPQ
ncbi:hypothetical protein [Marinilabilia rubra]|uniref:Uncharacterized protein n=1 Tax=Marinilabilia rubra TaxID=2162893 RepID=A0A2U2BBA8_9BACT|nr:hypothetical protein [Marinilabilia rubra]PWE00355.1 hypothetical protein DDZ16_05290 [Marinilabilia rubra]